MITKCKAVLKFQQKKIGKGVQGTNMFEEGIIQKLNISKFDNPLLPSFAHLSSQRLIIK